MDDCHRILDEKLEDSSIKRDSNVIDQTKKGRKPLVYIPFV